MAGGALPPVFVIGMGEVGRRLASALERAGADVRPVTRSEGWDEAVQAPEGLRILAMREGDLPAALERLRGVPPERLVAVQNGWIRPLLEPFPGCGRGLIWFMSKGDFFNQLRPSPFTGPFAGTLVATLRRGGLEVEHVADPAAFARLEADKMGFNCVVGLPLAVHGLTLGEYLARHHDEARAVFTEAASTCAAALGADWDESWWPEFVATVEPLAWVKTSRAKALEYRNGAVLMLARRLGRDAPANRRLLAAAGWEPADPSFS